MRVSLVTSLAGGGPVEHAILLAKGLSALGADVDAFCPTSLVDRFARAGAKTATSVELNSWRSAGAAMRLRRSISAADVVHTHDRRVALWLLGATPRSRRTARVHTAHGIASPYLPEPIGTLNHGVRDRLAYEAVEPLIVRGADAIIVPSRSVAEDLATRLHWPLAKMHVIPNGVEVSDAPLPQRESVRVIGTVSRLDPFKGLDVFLRAAALVHEQNPEVRFLVFGEGEDEEKLRALATALRLDSHLAFPGFVSAPEAFPQLDVFVSSSYWENAPIALLEAMAAGVPVVATTAGGIPEIASDGSAELVRPGDPLELASALVRLVRDPARARMLHERALRRVREQFSFELTAERIYALYDEIVAKRGRRRDNGSA